MKNRSAISFTFGLLLLAILSYQMMDTMLHWYSENDRIELAELCDDIEEEEDLHEEVFLIYTDLSKKSEYYKQRRNTYPISAGNYPSVEIKIPLPPPELA